jgi:hypothetical protein
MHLFQTDIELQLCVDLLVRGTELLTARIYRFSAQIQPYSFRTLPFQLEDLIIVIKEKKSTWEVEGALYSTHPSLPNTWVEWMRLLHDWRRDYGTLVRRKLHGSPCIIPTMVPSPRPKLGQGSGCPVSHLLHDDVLPLAIRIKFPAKLSIQGIDKPLPKRVRFMY